MFAYCGNNIVNRFDPTGQYMAATDFGFSGGGIGLTGGTSYGGAKTTSQEVARKSNTRGMKSPEFLSGKREAKELIHEAIQAYKEITSFADIYPEVKIYEGISETNDGVNTFINGVQLLRAPVPTCIEDVVGVGLCTWGVLQTVGGFVKTLVGFKEL